MIGVGSRKVQRRGAPGDLYARIGELLRAQGLPPDPANYAFAHHLLSRDDAEAAAIVARVLDDGVRLTGREIAALGGQPVAGVTAPTSAANDAERGRGGVELDAQRLVEQTRVQADTVAAMVREMHDETRDFGRDLAQSAAQFDAAARPDQIARLTATMVARAASAEDRLATATREADALRAELAEAHATARRDSLTGLPNRRAFDEAFAAIDPDDAYCLALIDIDRFKRINDRFGHLVGDRVLVALARLLSEHGAGHLVARQGGEEFALLLRGVDIAGAHTIIDGARAAIAGRRLRDRESAEPIGQVTFSAGIIALRRGEPREAAIARADALLYRAKETGRDRVMA